MSHLAKTLKRLGVAAVGACTLLATPYLGAPALAATPTAPTTIALLSQAQGSASTANDGTDTTVRISAAVTVPIMGTPTVASVRFSYQITGSPVVLIGTDTTVPYSVDWTPPGAGSYTELAEAFSATGASINATSRAVNVDAVTPAVHVVTPTDGGLLGRSGSGSVLVTGTRSVTLPVLSIVAATRDNSTGIISASGAATTIPAGGLATWSASVAAPACPNSGTSACDVFITATAGTLPSASDEVTRASLYTQVLSNLTVTPTSASRSTNSAQPFIATPVDQNNQIVPGITITITKNAGSTATLTPTSGVSAYPTGQVTFNVKDTSLATTRLTISTGTTSADFARFPSFTTYLSPPTTAAFLVTGLKPLYATSFPGTAPNNGNVASPGSEYTASTAAVDICFSDVNAIPIDSSVPATGAKVSVSVSRVTRVGAVFAAPVVTTPTPVSDQTANPGCYSVAHAAAGGEDSGSDTFTAFMNNDGNAGYQAGGTDILAPPLTLKWGQLKIVGINTQAVQSTRLIVTMAMVTPDGTPFPGRTMGTFTPYVSPGATVVSTNATFQALQPVGTKLISASSATCTTNALGQCSVVVSNPMNEQSIIRLDDTVSDPTTLKTATNGFGQLAVQFRATPVTLVSVLPSVVPPLLMQPAVNTSAGNLRPGDVQRYGYTLRDSGTLPLAGVSTTLTLNNGFFTQDCQTYSACGFTTAPADGAPVGSPVNLGKTTTVFSDINGLINFSVSIGRDTGLDATGSLVPTVTITANSGTVTAPLPAFTTAGITPANGGTMTLLPLTAADAMTGNVSSNGSNKIFMQAGTDLSPGTNFRVALTDGFANPMTLPTCSIPLVVTGAGAGYLNTPGTSTLNACGSFAATANLPATERFRLDSDDQGIDGNLGTLTASWPAPVTQFKALATNPVTYTTAAGSPATVTRTGSIAITLYAVNLNALTTVFSSSPAAANVALSTPVTVNVSVKDQKQNPQPGMRVGFQRTGPDTAAGNPQGSSAFAYTDTTGLASFTYTSPSPGLATVLASLTNQAGSQLASGQQSVTFGSIPPSPTASPSASPTASPTGSPTVSPTPQPTGPVTIDGSSTQHPDYGSTCTITGTAPADATVVLHFHKGGTPADDYSIERTVTADSAGIWSRDITANVDYRYYATSGAATSTSVLNQPAPIVLGPTARVVTSHAVYVLAGRAVPGSTVYVHFHKPGTPASDYSIVRAVTADSSGTWVKSFLASTDYRLYVSDNADDSAAFTSYLVQAR